MYIYKGKGRENQGLKQKIEDDIRWAAGIAGIAEEEFGALVEKKVLLSLPAAEGQDTLS